MDEQLMKLYNTMSLIETKGENTKIMCDCLRFIESLIDSVKEKTIIKEQEN